MTPELEAPINLDGFTNPKELWEFWKSASGVRPIATARKLFPTRPRGYVRATKDLGNYAVNKATAMRCRLDGGINTALIFEDICDTIYDRLPEYAKW